jgi:peptidoglycan/LPS O-acetylase OafA/YrhL
MGLWRVAGQANGALWSLMLEELLYVGHVILQIRKWWNARTSAGLMALCILGWMICRQDAVVRPIFEASTAFFVGNLAYFNMPKIERIAGWKFVGIFIAIRVFANLTSPLPATAPQMLFYSTSSAVLLVLAARNLPQIKWRKMPDLSYGCYIFHVIVLTIVLRHSGGIDALWWTLAGSLSLAAVSWYCLESQALKWKERPPHGSARRAIETEDLQWEWLS